MNPITFSSCRNRCPPPAFPAHSWILLRGDGARSQGVLSYVCRYGAVSQSDPSTLVSRSIPIFMYACVLRSQSSIAGVPEYHPPRCPVRSNPGQVKVKSELVSLSVGELHIARLFLLSWLLCMEFLCFYGYFLYQP